MSTLIAVPHGHQLSLWKKGFPLKLCKCGYIEGIYPKVGRNTIDVGAAGAADVVRWSATQAAIAAGDLGMGASSAVSSNGRPRAFIENESKDINAHLDEIGGGLRRHIIIQQDGSLTTISTIGISAAPTATGTAANQSASDGNGNFIEYTSAAVNPSDAGIIAPTFDQTRFDRRFIFDKGFRLGGGALTTLRYWIGLFSGNPMASATPALHLAAFRYDTATDGTTWRAVTDSGTGTPTVTDTTVTVATLTSYRLRIVVDSAGANIRFYINGILRATHSATLPGATTNLGYCAQVRTLSAAARFCRLGVLYISQKASA